MLPWILLPHLILADPPGDWFVVDLPALDSTPSYLDASFLNPEPAGAAGFVRVDGAHFVDGRGERVRFFGSNLTLGAAYVDHDLAEKMAARLRKMGVNIIRLHHLDNRTAPAGIWLDNAAGTFDPQQLDRLDYLIFQLKQHGIYVNLNLHVSRNYPGIDFNALPRTFNYGKVLDNYHPRLIALQKQYASDLLGHVNPYTGARYADEPAIAMIELNNENTLLGAYRNRELLALPDELRAPLEDGWRAWVRARYGSLEGATAAWLQGLEPLGEELLTNGDFAEGTQRWQLEAPAPAVATMTAADGVLRATMTQPGRESWHFQVHQVGLNLIDGATYTVRFEARADAPRSITVNVRRDREDWRNNGLDAQVGLTPNWTAHRFIFTASDTQPDHARLSFTLGNVPGTVELRNVSLRRGASLDLPEGATLATLPMPIGAGLRAQSLDWVRYLAETEGNYVAELRRHLRETIGVKAPIICTQASYGGLGGIAREAGLNEYIDMHAYWHHPSFPVRPWDPVNWLVAGEPLAAAADGGTMPRLAAYRVAGLPFTVSEYDHPAPMLAAHELWPIFAATACLQDWDGLFQFNWGSSADNLTADRITGFFNLCTHPGKLAAMPLAAIMFRRGLLPPLADEVVLEIGRDRVPELVAGGVDAPRAWERAGAQPGLSARQRVAVRLVDGDAQPRLVGAPTPQPEGALSDSPPLLWRPGEEALFQVTAPQVVVLSGKLAGRTVTAGPLTLTLEAAPQAFCSLMLVALDDQPLERSRRMALSLAGASINTGMGWNEQFTSVGNRWGTAPTLQAALRGEIRLRTEVDRLTVVALDGAGAPRTNVPARRADGGLSFAVSPEQRAIWYALSEIGTVTNFSTR